MEALFKLLLLISCILVGECFLSGQLYQSCRILTPLINNGEVARAREAARVNDTNFLGIENYAGFITVKEQYNSNLFFWYFPKSRNTAQTPWIIWLQGGPGVSSMKGLFDLIGPIKIVDGQVKPRNVTWANDYSLLFLDNPVGAGFSFTLNDAGYPDNEDDVGDQMFEFLDQFLSMFPELRQAPLFIAGQSYAGKYVPALGIKVHQHRHTSPINLKGLMIGNGLIDPRSMMHYSELCRVFGILDDNQLQVVEALERSVIYFIDNMRWTMASQEFNRTIEYIKQQSGVSVYNFLKDPSSGAPAFEDFLTRPDVREWIHVGNATFDYNNQLVYEKMLPDIMNTTKPWLEELLEYYGVMCYSGQLDVILGYSLSKYTYDLLDWSRRVEYDMSNRVQLRRTPQGPVIGYKRSGGNFVEVLIRNAGHSTMAEQPEATKFVVDTFINEFK